MKLLLLIVAAFVFAKCAGKFGFRTTLQWACLLIVSVFPLSLAGGLLKGPVTTIWNGATPNARLAIVAIPGVVFAGAIKRCGLGAALAYTFEIVVFIAALILCGLGAFLAVVFGGQKAGL